MENKFVQLTGAVYRLLDFFPDGEPLKNRAKEKALAITENLVLVFDTQEFCPLAKKPASAGREKAEIKLLEDIEVFLNYLKLAKSLGWIDSINFLIISKEYEKIRGQISQLVIKPAPAQKAENTSIITQTQKVALNPEFSISDRQKKILQILNEKGKAQVSDFKTVLNDVTKRTIRRDLDELLKNGEIIRVGEWNQVFYQVGQR